MASLLLDTIKGIARKRPPVWFMRQAGRVLPSYMKLRESHSFSELMNDPQMAADVTLLPVADLGVDAAILFSDILVIPDAMGMKLVFTDHGPVFDHPLTEAANQLSSLKLEPSKLDHIYKTIDLIVKQKPADIPLIGFCGAPFTTFCYMVQGISSNHSFPEAVKLIYNDRQTATKLLDMITELSIEYALNQVKHKIDVFQLFETHAGLLPNDVYVEVVLPRVRRVCDAVRATGTPVIYFPKGIGAGLTRIKDMADVISIDWQTPIVQARQILGSEVGIQGNLDPRILSVKDKSTITKELEKYIGFGSNESRWIFNLGHGLMPDNTFENTKFVIDWIKSTDWGK